MRDCPIDNRCVTEALRTLRIRRTPKERFPFHMAVAARIAAELMPQTPIQGENESASRNPAPWTRPSPAGEVRPRGRSTQEPMDPPLPEMQHPRAEQLLLLSRAAPCLCFRIRS